MPCLQKENNEKGDLEAGKSSNENEGNAVKFSTPVSVNFKIF
jgi:hypothetical protein